MSDLINIVLLTSPIRWNFLLSPINYFYRKLLYIEVRFVSEYGSVCNSFNPFFPNTFFLYLMKTVFWCFLMVFWCFQCVAKGCIGNEWVKWLLLTINQFKVALSGLRQFLPTGSPLQMTKSPFYFTIKTIFIIQFWSYPKFSFTISPEICSSESEMARPWPWNQKRILNNSNTDAHEMHLVIHITKEQRH